MTKSLSKAVRLPLKKEKDSFILKLNKKLYRKDLIQKAVSEDKEWIDEAPASGAYFCLRLKTPSMDDVLNWMNYLIYLHKA